MTFVVNSPESFAAESLEGLAAAHPDIVRLVDGGVVRAHRPADAAEVCVVAGGGAGHLPAFAGWVGAGMAHGAVCGDIFASPSSGLVEKVVRAAEMGRGVVLVHGNYTGDAISFRRAADELQRAGIPTRTVAVSDDVASSVQPRLRRGIAGDLVVLKTAAAAAERGDDLDAVHAAATEANRRTTSLGIAFSGISLPGATAPLFTVEDGQVAVGLGIHGEPGLRLQERASADDLADLLLDGLLAENKIAGRVAVIINGLGGTSPEELYLLYRRVARRLMDIGVSIVAPVVDNQVTSLGMAGVSLTLTRVTDDLEELWLHPARSIGFTRDAGAGVAAFVPPAEGSLVTPTTRAARRGGDVRRREGTAIVAALRRAETAVRRAQQRLGELDAVAGDGDHGIGMVRGISAARQAAEAAVAEGSGPRETLERAASAWGRRAGGTSGALWEVMLAAAARELPELAAPTLAEIGAAVDAAIGALIDVGGARPGDKTIVDAAAPYRRVILSARSLDAGVFARAADAAEDAASRTAAIRARTGRALKHGERSIGAADPGATSFAIVVRALADPAPEGTVAGDALQGAR